MQQKSDYRRSLCWRLQAPVSCLQPFRWRSRVSAAAPGEAIFFKRLVTCQAARLADNADSRPGVNRRACKQEQKMAKGQQSQKMVKKPKKDSAPPKPVSLDAVRPTVTTVVPVRGKLKNAPTRGA